MPLYDTLPASGPQACSGVDDPLTELNEAPYEDRQAALDAFSAVAGALDALDDAHDDEAFRSAVFALGDYRRDPRAGYLL